MRVGGPRDLVEAVKAEGGQPGPMSVWVTGGALKWGTSNLDSHYAACKAAGVDPLVLFWFWGDDISNTAIRDGVTDQYQGTWKTRAKALELAATIGAKATAAGVRPVVAIEHEFAQEGLETDPSQFAPYYDAASAAIRKACPAARLAFTCPIWEDEALMGRTYAAQIAASDLVASQTILFLPRHGVTEFRNAGLNFEAAFANLRRLAPGKPSAVIDLGFSSYGGAYSPTAPFAGGDGRAREALQAEAIQSVGTVPGLDFIVYRGLKDASAFDVKNYGGYAERHVGVVRADGSRKPAYAALMALARQPDHQPSQPATVPLTLHEAVLAERDAVAAKALAFAVEKEALAGKIQAAKAALA